MLCCKLYEIETDYIILCLHLYKPVHRYQHAFLFCWISEQQQWLNVLVTSQPAWPTWQKKLIKLGPRHWVMAELTVLLHECNLTYRTIGDERISQPSNLATRYAGISQELLASFNQWFLNNAKVLFEYRKITGNVQNHKNIFAVVFIYHKNT